MVFANVGIANGVIMKEAKPNDEVRSREREREKITEKIHLHVN